MAQFLYAYQNCLQIAKIIEHTPTLYQSQISFNPNQYLSIQRQMKNEEDYQFQKLEHSLERLEAHNLGDTNLFNGILLTCRGNNPAYEYCSQQGCTKEAVICQNQKCKCQTDHQICDNFVRVNKFHKKINSKVIGGTAEIIDQIDTEVQKITNRVSQMFDEFKQMLKSFGLNKSDETIRQKITNHFQDSDEKMAGKCLTGNSFYEHRESSKQATKNWFEYSYEKYKKVLKITQDQILPMFQNISSALTYIHTTQKAEKDLSNYFVESKILMKSDNMQSPAIHMLGRSHGIMSNASSIDLTPRYLIEKLEKSMEVNSIKKIFSYQSSQFESFSRDNLLKKISDKSDLLFLVKTKSASIYGAFVPIKLETEESALKENAEIRQQTLIFSLTGQFCDELTKEKSGFVYREQFNSLQIGSVRTSESMNNVKLLIHFDKDNILTELWSPQNQNNQLKLVPQRRGQVEKKSDESSLSVVTVINLEVYQVFVNKLIRPQCNKDKESQPKAIINEKPAISGTNNLFGACRASSIFGGSKMQVTQGSLFAPRK